MRVFSDTVFVVIQLTRGASDVVAVFHEELHAKKFIAHMKKKAPGSYKFFQSGLWNFSPDTEEELTDIEVQL